MMRKMKIERYDVKCFNFADEDDRYDNSLIVTNTGKNIQLWGWRDQTGRLCLDISYEHARALAEWLNKTLAGMDGKKDE